MFLQYELWNDCPIDWLTITNQTSDPELNVSYIQEDIYHGI